MVIFDDVASLLEKNGSYIKDRDSKREGLIIIQIKALWFRRREKYFFFEELLLWGNKGYLLIYIYFQFNNTVVSFLWIWFPVTFRLCVISYYPWFYKLAELPVQIMFPFNLLGPNYMLTNASGLFFMKIQSVILTLHLF